MPLLILAPYRRAAYILRDFVDFTYTRYPTIVRDVIRSYCHAKTIHRTVLSGETFADGDAMVTNGVSMPDIYRDVTLTANPNRVLTLFDENGVGTIEDTDLDGYWFPKYWQRCGFGPSDLPHLLACYPERIRAAQFRMNPYDHGAYPTERAQERARHILEEQEFLRNPVRGTPGMNRTTPSMLSMGERVFSAGVMAKGNPKDLAEFQEIRGHEHNRVSTGPTPGSADAILKNFIDAFIAGEVDMHPDDEYLATPAYHARKAAEAKAAAEAAATSSSSAN